MMICKFALYFTLILTILLCFGCGGGAGTPPVAQPTKATLKLSTSGTLATGTALGGIGITVNLPAGVTVKTDSSGDALLTGVVTVSGVAVPGTFTPPVYIPASGTTPGTVSFIMASSATAGFGTGEFATVNCDISSGSDPKLTDFTLTNFKPIDLNGADISGLTVSVAATIQ